MASLREPTSTSTLACNLEALRSTFASLWAVYEGEPDCNPPTGDHYAWTAWKTTRSGQLFNALNSLSSAITALERVR
jgi:hypothetical protein